MLNLASEQPAPPLRGGGGCSPAMLNLYLVDFKEGVNRFYAVSLHTGVCVWPFFGHKMDYQSRRTIG